MVLWVMLLLTIITGSFSLMARMDRIEAHTLLSGTQARLSAEAGLNIAVLSLRDPNDETRMIADGRLYAQYLDGVLLEVRATDERGKLDINTTDEITMANMFVGNGLELEQAEVLAAAVMDWRDTDELERVNGAEAEAYEAAGLAVGPGNRPFIMTEELLQVLGMPYELYRQIEPGLTVFSGSGTPHPAFAPLQALLSMPDITRDEAQQFIEARQAMVPGESLGVELPDGSIIMEQGRGVTYSIKIKATMPNGIWEQLEATIRLGGNPKGNPYQVLRWREGFQY